MLSKGIFLVGGVIAAGAALVLGGGGTAHAASGGAKAADPAIPPEVVNEIAQAMSTADPTTIRNAADDVQRKGFPTHASEMRGVATAIENAQKQAAKTAPIPGLPAGQTLPPLPVIALPPNIALPPLPGVPGFPPILPIPPGVVLPPLPSGIPPLPGFPGVTQTAPGVDPAAALAHRVALNVASSTRGAEDRDLMVAFQNQENSRGHTVGKTDGLYGPKSALALAQDFGIVPPHPLYWPKNPAPAKAAYTKAILALGASDPARATEWAKASDVRFSGQVV